MKNLYNRFEEGWEWEGEEIQIKIDRSSDYRKLISDGTFGSIFVSLVFHQISYDNPAGSILFNKKT